MMKIVNQSPTRPLRVAMLLPGLGRVQRGAETAFLEIARGLADFPDVEVELFGTGSEGPPDIRLHQVGCVQREWFERWPRIPCLRSEYQYEELTFVMNLLWRRCFQPGRFDVTMACTFPYVNWLLQRAGRRDGPLQVFITENGDWMCHARNREYRTFDCDGLVCINPMHVERNRARFPTALIPNGVDPDLFHPSTTDETKAQARAVFGLPADRPVVLMSSALIPSKDVAGGVRAMAGVPGAFLVVAGDGPERATVARLAEQLLPARHRLLGSIPRTQMPMLYRAADAFLHMSQDEPFGIVYLEAAATGLPCVVHDGPVQRWIFGDTARFAPARNIDAVCAQIRNVLGPAGRLQGAQARERVMTDWTWKAQAAKYRAFLYQLLADRGRMARVA